MQWIEYKGVQITLQQLNYIKEQEAKAEKAKREEALRVEPE